MIGVRRPPLILLGLLLGMGLHACLPAISTDVQPPASLTPPAHAESPTGIVPQPQPLTAAAPTETPFLPTAIPLEEPRPEFARTRYHLDAQLDYAARLLDVQQVVIYPNRNGEPLNELLFLVDANWNAGEFELLSLHWADGTGIEPYFLDGGFLTIPLPVPLDPDESVTVNITYRLHIPYEASKLGYYARQLNLCDWYPVAAAYRPGSGWLAYPPSPVGETLVYESGDYEVRLAVANAPENLVVAASLRAERDESAYLYKGDALRSFAFSMSDVFEVLNANAGDVEVVSYFRPEDRAAGMAALQAAVQSINVFSELFGPYPHAFYSAVEGNFPDGLEFDGLAFTGREYYGWYDGTLQNYLVLITVHETAHQWFYGLVGNDQAFEPWLDEALTIYAEYLFLEEVHPELADWWWEYRLDEFRPLYGDVNSPVYAYRSYRPYVDAVYLRGAEMLDAVRTEIGREVFIEALGVYLVQHRHTVAAGEDLLGLFESLSGRSLDAVLAPYFSVRD